MIWPFVEGYWAWAATRAKQLPVFSRELNALVKLSEKNETFMELYHPQDGAPDGSRDQLWSAAGYLSMVCHGLCGMEFEPGGIRFAPIVPDGLGPLSMRGVKYRGSRLEIVVTGEGASVKRFAVDGEASGKHFFDAAKTGAHRIEIEVGE